MSSLLAHFGFGEWNGIDSKHAESISVDVCGGLGRGRTAVVSVVLYVGFGLVVPLFFLSGPWCFTYVSLHTYLAKASLGFRSSGRIRRRGRGTVDTIEWMSGRRVGALELLNMAGHFPRISAENSSRISSDSNRSLSSLIKKSSSKNRIDCDDPHRE